VYATSGRSLFAFRVSRARASRGFTLTELIAVLVIAAILAVTAFALLNPREFDAGRFADEALVQLEYAQKVAVAARRTVTVSVAGNTVSLTMCADAGCGSTVPVPSPTGEASYVRSAPSGVTIAPAAMFSFNALGGTDLASNLTLTITGTIVRTVTVEAITGYVHP